MYQIFKEKKNLLSNKMSDGAPTGMFKLKRYTQIAFILKYSVICQRHDSRVFLTITTIRLPIVYYSFAVVYEEIEYFFMIKIYKYIIIYKKYRRCLYHLGY